MEFFKRLKFRTPWLTFLLLFSCASSVDKSLFDTSEEATKNVLNDSYIVEEQKKLAEYKPDIATSKPHKFSKGKSKGAKAKTEAKSKIVGISGTKDQEFSLSQSDAWKDQDKKSQSLWKSFSPNYLKIGEKMVLKVTYSGISAASVALEIMPLVRYQSRDVYHFHARAKTADFYKWIYSLNDTIDSVVDKEHFISWKYSLIQNEKSKNIEDIQFYDRKSLMTFSFYKKTKSGQTTEEKNQAEMPFYGQDYFSSLYFIRGLPLNNNDHYIFPTTTKSKSWLMSVKVVQRENLKIGIGEFKAIKLEVTTNYTGELAKKGAMFLWLSDDPQRALLSSSAEVKIGSVKLELLEYRLGDQIIFGDKQ